MKMFRWKLDVTKLSLQSLKSPFWINQWLSGSSWRNSMEKSQRKMCKTSETNDTIESWKDLNNMKTQVNKKTDRN